MLLVDEKIMENSLDEWKGNRRIDDVLVNGIKIKYK